MRDKKIFIYVHLVLFLIAGHALAMAKWHEITHGEAVWHDPVIIISCLVMAIYSLSISFNWGGLADNISNEKWTQAQRDRHFKIMRITFIILAICTFMIIFSRIMLILIHYFVKS